MVHIPAGAFIAGSDLTEREIAYQLDELLVSNRDALAYAAWLSKKTGQDLAFAHRIGMGISRQG